MDNTDILMEKIERLDNKVQGMVNQLDSDRKDIDNLRIDQGAIKDGQTAIINQMTDFKKEIRQIVEDTITSEVPKAVKKAVSKELTSIRLKNPNKVIEKHHKVLESFYLLFNKIYGKR